MRLTTTFFGLACLLLMAPLASAEAIDSFFDVTIDVMGNATGGGSGYDEGTWFKYPNSAPAWWNEWFYNDPFDPMRWKEWSLDFHINPVDSQLPAYAEVTINWTTGAWSNLGLGRPPLPSDVTDLALENLYIERLTDPEFDQTIFEGTVIYDPLGTHVMAGGTLPVTYNPEWVSIDIRGYNVVIADGYFKHECVPEPASLALLGLGAMLLRRRRH